MPTLMTLQQAYEQWAEEVKPLVIEAYGEEDEVALAESWNDYTDELCKDGYLTNLQYHYCLPWDEEPEDDDILFCINELVGERLTKQDAEDILEMIEDLR